MAGEALNRKGLRRRPRLALFYMQAALYIDRSVASGNGSQGQPTEENPCHVLCGRVHCGPDRALARSTWVNRRRSRGRGFESVVDVARARRSRLDAPSEP